MLKVVTGLALLTRVDVKRPMAPKRRFNNSVYSERTKNALMLKGAILTSPIQIKPASEVTRFSKKIFIMNFKVG